MSFMEPVLTQMDSVDGTCTDVIALQRANAVLREHNERLRAEHSGALRRLDTTRNRYFQQMWRVAELSERLSRYESSSRVGVSGGRRPAVLGPRAGALVPYGW